MLYFTWIPADPNPVRALVPSSLQLADNAQCFINQYVVDATEQTSGFEAYSLTYCGADLNGHDTPDGAIPGRWWTHYFNSNSDMRAYAAKRGVPAGRGETTLEIADGILTATTSADDTPVIRTTARVGDEVADTGRGRLRYITDVDGRPISGLYPCHAGLVQPWEILSFEFLVPDHPVSAPGRRGAGRRLKKPVADRPRQMTLAPPLHGFVSDNVVGAHPKVIEALVAANVGSASPYGEDPWTSRAVSGLRAIFNADAEVLFTYGGTGANVAALQSLLLPHQAVICPATAHINIDECGAPERFTGAKLIDIPITGGKLRPEHVTHLLGQARGEHSVRPAVMVISQVTELGTVYTVEEVAALAEFAHAHELVLFVDGARLANAVAALGCSLREMTLDAGVDALTFDDTRNGLLYGEAVVYLRPELARRARFARKQAGQLASKMRSIAAQFEALLADDLWLQNATHANRMAASWRPRSTRSRRSRCCAARKPTASSRVSPAARIEATGVVAFLLWDAAESAVRWMTSFATTDEDVRRFAAGLRHVVDGGALPHDT